jgi:5-methylcytosine-specific restriction endonuclease McrA
MGNLTTETKICTGCGAEKPATLEFFSKNGNRLLARCKKCAHTYYIINSIRIKARSAKAYAKNPELAKARHHVYVELNKYEIQRWNKHHYKNNKELYKMQRLRRSARRAELPNNYTAMQWKRCLEFFNYACVICGEAKALCADHWIPLDSSVCPGTVAHNILPLCGSCNSRKHNKMPVEWLQYSFDEVIVQRVLARIGAYLETQNAA